MNKAIFLDRDGTINKDKSYIYRISDFELLDGVVEGLIKLKEAGFLLIVITNQSGIARGYFSEEEYSILNMHMKSVLEKAGVHIDDVLYCPHHPQGIVEKYAIDCECRKPKLGLYNEAIKKWNIDINKSYAIGDKIRDCAICKDTNCKGFLIDLTKNRENENIEIVDSVLSAAKRILEDNCSE